MKYQISLQSINNSSLIVMVLAVVLSGCGGADSGTNSLNGPTEKPFIAISSSTSSIEQTTSSRTSSMAQTASSRTSSMAQTASSRTSSMAQTASSHTSSMAQTASSSMTSFLASSKSKSSSQSSAKSASMSSKSLPTNDHTPPSTPDSFVVNAVFYDVVSLSWTPATDNVGVVSYKIYRDQIQIETLSEFNDSYIDFNVAPSKRYSYGVSVGDAAGNWSPIQTLFTQTPAAPQQPSSSSVSSQAASSSPQSSLTSSTPAASSTTSSNLNSSRSTSAANSSNTSHATSSTNSSASSSSSSNSSVPLTAGNVTLSWFRPTVRENGTSLPQSELGGYEIRYKLASAINYTLINISDNNAVTYTILNLSGNYEFQIAAYDTNQLYSNYILLSPH